MVEAKIWGALPSGWQALVTKHSAAGDDPDIPQHRAQENDANENSRQRRPTPPQQQHHTQQVCTHSRSESPGKLWSPQSCSSLSCGRMFASQAINTSPPARLQGQEQMAAHLYPAPQTIKGFLSVLPQQDILPQQDVCELPRSQSDGKLPHSALSISTSAHMSKYTYQKSLHQRLTDETSSLPPRQPAHTHMPLCSEGGREVGGEEGEEAASGSTHQEQEGGTEGRRRKRQLRQLLRDFEREREGTRERDRELEREWARRKGEMIRGSGRDVESISPRECLPPTRHSANEASMPSTTHPAPLSTTPSSTPPATPPPLEEKRGVHEWMGGTFFGWAPNVILPVFHGAQQQGHADASAATDDHAMDGMTDAAEMHARLERERALNTTALEAEQQTAAEIDASLEHELYVTAPETEAEQQTASFATLGSGSGEGRDETLAERQVSMYDAMQHTVSFATFDSGSGEGRDETCTASYMDTCLSACLAESKLSMSDAMHHAMHHEMEENTTINTAHTHAQSHSCAHMPSPHDACVQPTAKTIGRPAPPKNKSFFDLILPASRWQDAERRSHPSAVRNDASAKSWAPLASVRHS